ncbi:MAG: CHAP domain-containing protein [Succinivibrionaceae bacterium]|nr:CHAP domain-containing protein [Succinivibrionaceae bacterium]
MSNEQRIWNFLWERLGNAFGVAGLMGNLRAESALKPTNLQGTFEKKLGMTDDSYTAAVDNGSYKNFVKDSAGYGLAQWTYWTRKQNLLNFAKEKGVSIGDLDMQLEFLLKELGSYKSVLKALINAKSVREASDAVLTQYEKPKNQGESVKMARAKYGQQYYDQFAVTTVEPVTGEKEEKTMSYDPKKVIQVAEAEVGYLEKKSNSKLDDKTANAGDKNYTKYARDLDALGFYNGKKQSVAWCDIFVDWCFVQAYGLEAALKLTNQPLGKSNCGAGCKYSRGYYQKMGRLFTKPEPGDQIFFWPKDGIGGYAIQHTGLVYAVDDTYVYTIEGNTSGANGVIANGGGVCKKKYKLTYNRIAGYGRPRWDLETTEPVKTETPATQAEPENTVGGKVVTITAASLNVRVGDSQKYDSVGTVKKGEKYEWVATSPTTGWHAIRTDKRIGWVSPNYSKVEAA